MAEYTGRRTLRRSPAHRRGSRYQGAAVTCRGASREGRWKQVTAVTSGSLHWHFARTLRHRTKAASTRRGGSAGPLNGGGIEANKHPQAYRRWPRVRPVIDDEKIQDLLQRACGRPVLREAILNQLLQAAMPERLCAEPGERTDRRYAHRLETVSRLLKNRDGSVLA